MADNSGHPSFQGGDKDPHLGNEDDGEGREGSPSRVIEEKSSPEPNPCSESDKTNTNFSGDSPQSVRSVGRPDVGEKQRENPSPRPIVVSAWNNPISLLKGSSMAGNGASEVGEDPQGVVGPKPSRQGGSQGVGSAQDLVDASGDESGSTSSYIVDRHFRL